MTFEPRPGWETERIATSPTEADGPFHVELRVDGEPAIVVSPEVEFQTGCAPSERQEMASARVIAYLPFHPEADRLVFRRDEYVIYEREIASEPPEIEVESLRVDDEEEVTVTWSARGQGDAELTFNVLYVADRERGVPVVLRYEEEEYTVDTSWLPGADEAQIAVLATDGVRSSFDMSESFSIEAKPPRVWIQQPNEEEVVPFNQPVSLIGQATDITGRSLDDDGLIWYVDDEEISVKTRTAVATRLEAGEHTAELHYAPAGEVEARSEVSFEIGDPSQTQRRYEAAISRLDETLNRTS